LPLVAIDRIQNIRHLYLKGEQFLGVLKLQTKARILSLKALLLISPALKPRLAKQRLRAERGDCFRGQGLGSQEIFGLACRPAHCRACYGCNM